MKKDEIRPIVLTDNESGDKYTLEFTRETVKFAQFKGFDIDDIEKKPMIAVPDLFYYAFRANHKNISREKTDKILFEDLGGMPSGMLERLMQLYYLPYETLLSQDEKETKNAKMTVEM